MSYTCSTEHWMHSHFLVSNGGGIAEGWNRNTENICGSKEC